MPNLFRLLRVAPWRLLAATLAMSTAAHADGTSIWDFAVLLDARPIGTHRFELIPTAGASRSLQSQARFKVKILGITAYSYQHDSREQWSGDCLSTIDATTDDDGDTTVVSGKAAGDGFAATARTGKKSAQAATRGCLLSFAYWNPEHLATQHQLLDPGTGRIETVTITALPAAMIPVHTTSTAVTGLRITGLKHPIDVWYAAGNRWVGLDTTVEGGRKLTYRLP